MSMEAFSVGQFIEFLNTALSTAVFPEGVAVEGEVSDFRVSQGKWIWFVLKDDDSAISCFSTVWQLRTPLEDGMQVRVHGVPKVYPRSGKFSITVERAEPVGEGALKRAFELMRKKLEEEGLFDTARKRALPRFPRRIGLITSRDAAACTDFLRILGNRWGGVEVDLAHVQVQGRDAERDIVGAFRWFNAHAGDYDVLVLTRGGGSLEDLQAFNSEEVARAVFSSKVPVVVGVGHERDTTLVDYVADVRASTPSNAAELTVPDRKEVLSTVASSARRVMLSMEGAVAERRADIDRCTARLEAAVSRSTAGLRRVLRDLRERLLAFEASVGRRRAATGDLAARLATIMTHRIDRFRDDIAAKERILTGLDPRRVLARGYAIVTGPTGVLRDAAAVRVGDALDITLREGTIGARVTRTSKKKGTA